MKIKKHKTMCIKTFRVKPNIAMIMDEINDLSMNYIGNKRKILEWIYSSLEDENIFLEDYNVFDAFSGGGSVGIFCKKCYCPIVVTNDLMKNAWVNHKVLIESDEHLLSTSEKAALLNHTGIYKELLDWLQTQDYKWFSDSEEKKQVMIDYIKQKSVGNKYLEFMMTYCNKFFTLKECIELASFRDFIDENEDIKND